MLNVFNFYSPHRKTPNLLENQLSPTFLCILKKNGHQSLYHPNRNHSYIINYVAVCPLIAIILT